MDMINSSTQAQPTATSTTTLNQNQNNKANDSKLYNLTSIESKDQLELTIEESYNKLQTTLYNQQSSDTVIHNDLMQYSNQSKQHQDDVCNALLFSIMIDQTNCNRNLRYLLLLNNTINALQPQGVDSYGTLISNLANIVLENYFKLLDVPRNQLIWLVRELAKARLTNIDKVFLHLIRNIQGGNLNEKNIWLAETMLDVLSESIDWLYMNTELLQTVVYTYLRVIYDHVSASLNQLRQREIDFCCKILRDKWSDCAQIGRDLIRLLQNLCKIPEIDAIWKEYLNASNGNLLLQLLRTPTRRRCLISRLTPDMERKIYFLITNVKFGLHKRYHDWFQRQYLSTPESQSIRVDIIRYICVVVHPTNEQLNAGLTPRWAVIGWLLNTCTNQTECANIKLAIFFDWLFYDSKRENIMFIEPGILLMFNSLRTHTNMTLMLFDFLCRIVSTYHPTHRDTICMGITNAFKDIMDKRVIQSINVFIDSGKLDKDLKIALQTIFPTIFGAQQQQQQSLMQQIPFSGADIPFKRTLSNPDLVGEQQTTYPQQQQQQQLTQPQLQQLPPSPAPPLTPPMSSDDNTITSAPASPASTGSFTSQISTTLATFSDDESESTTTSSTVVSSSVTTTTASTISTIDKQQTTSVSPTPQQQQQQQQQETYVKPQKTFISAEINEIKVEQHLSRLSENLNKGLVRLSKTPEPDVQFTIIEDLLTYLLKSELNQPLTQTQDLANCLIFYLKTNFTNQLLPDNYFSTLASDEENEVLNESINKRPIFALFKCLLQTEEETPEYNLLLKLMREMFTKQPRLSYYFLFFLRVNNDEENVEIFKDFCKFVSNNEPLDDNADKALLKAHLIQDMRLCEQDDADLFVFLTPYVNTHFFAIVVNDPDILQLIVSCIDCRHLKYLIALILIDDLTLFETRPKTRVKFLDCLKKSLEWESIEQIFFWKLLFAHIDVEIEYILPFLARLDYTKPSSYQDNSEAVCAIFEMLKTVEPTNDIIQAVICRKEDQMSKSLFIMWSKSKQSQLKQILAKLLERSFNNLNDSQLKNVSNRGLTQQNKPQNEIYKLQLPDVERILSHLNQLRSNSDCLSIILDDKVQEYLQKIYRYYSNDDLKRRYADLFTLIDEFENSDSKTKAQMKSKKKVAASGGSSSSAEKSKANQQQQQKRAKSKKQAQKHSNNNSSSDSDFEDNISSSSSSKQPPRKKPKHITNDNDSD